eukprot:scaffold21342_cov82-Phaeocystis_antarctica.AAC.1
MSAAFCLVEGRRGGSRRKGAGKGPRPRPAAKPVKAHAQLRFDSQRARLVMTRGRVRDVIVKDRASSACIGAMFAEVGIRTTNTGRRAPPFTALGGRLRLSCRCGKCPWPPTCGSCPSSDG